MNLLQSYRDFWLIPNIFLESFPTCCDSARDLRQSRGKRLNRVVILPFLAQKFGRVDCKTQMYCARRGMSDEVVVAKFSNTTKYGAIEDKLRLMRRSISWKLEKTFGVYFNNTKC